MNTNEHKAKKGAGPMTGIEFWHGTELGRALAGKLPPQLTRIILDIPVEGLVKIYYASIDTGPVLDLKWDEVIEHFDVCKPSGAGVPSESTRQFTDLIRAKIESGEICHSDILAACDLAEALDTRVHELYRQQNPR